MEKVYQEKGTLRVCILGEKEPVVISFVKKNGGGFYLIIKAGGREMSQLLNGNFEYFENFLEELK